MKTVAIDYVRQVLEQTLEKEHRKNPSKFFGGKNEICLHSFYEQLKTREEVDRFTETYQDLLDQQNRMDLIANGVVVAPDNPTYTNICTATIIPLSWSVAMRVQVKNRDKMIDTLNNLINQIKGKKIDICENTDGELFMVGTIGNDNHTDLSLESGDFLTEINSSTDYQDHIESALLGLSALGIDISSNENDKAYYYCYDTSAKKLVVVGSGARNENAIIYDFAHNQDIIKPIEKDIERYKMSFSFDSIKIDEPRTLNGNDFLTITLGGSATLVNSGVMLGNDLMAIEIKKDHVANVDYDFSDSETYYLEPLEMPSGNHANTQLSQLMSNHFITNSHTDGNKLTLQYSFILDREIPLLNQWFLYARYGENISVVDKDTITPNLVYRVSEIYSSWGIVERHTFLAKVVESIDLENTESDTMTILVNFQLQGEND